MTENYVALLVTLALVQPIFFEPLVLNVPKFDESTTTT